MDTGGPRRDDPLAGADGTAPPPPAADPTAGRARPTDLRPQPVTGDEAIAEWMDADRGRALEPWAPEPRDVPPPRPVPAQLRHRTLPPETVEPTAVRGGPREDEPVWRRERREEAEFRAEFGEWRADRTGASGPVRMGASSAGRLTGVRLGAPLIVLIAVLVAIAALALHL